jgi:hypothetical protein
MRRRLAPPMMPHMSSRSPDSVTKGVAWVLLAVVLVNVLPRVVGVPEMDLPSISVPDLPAWADAIHTVVKVKNWLVAAVVAVLIVGVLVDRKSRS